MDDSTRLDSSDRDTSELSDERETRRAELRAAVKRGLEDIEEGRVADLEAALDRIEAMLDELDAIKPSGR
ncbi:MAG TPA: hypothetical protein VEW26_15185 [Allosphingosinicella sp.]|nr:hypothetical protein [Allosphingosinicella sp.]